MLCQISGDSVTSLKPDYRIWIGMFLRTEYWRDWGYHLQICLYHRLLINNARYIIEVDLSCFVFRLRMIMRAEPTMLGWSWVLLVAIRKLTVDRRRIERRDDLGYHSGVTWDECLPTFRSRAWKMTAVWFFETSVATYPTSVTSQKTWILRPGNSCLVRGRTRRIGLFITT